jgi:sulfate adenylyltransferase (ADP) / ATP adenylyltransferase
MFLLEKAARVTQAAVASNHLSQIQVMTQPCVQGPHRFLLRVAVNLQQKFDSKIARLADPFLPYEPELYVADIAPHHVCLLNKFPVIANHLLLITRDFEPQESLLTWEDFEALGQLLDMEDGLVFYNCGHAAGASQRHKHLQWVPRTLGDDGLSLPLEPGQQPLPVPHYRCSLEKEDPVTRYALYQQGLSQLQWRPGLAYNLLLTRQWLLLIPRHCACWHGISINSLAFAGSFFVSNEEQAAQLTATGFIQVLQAVSGWDH